MEVRARYKHLVRWVAALLGLGLAGAAQAQITVQGRLKFDTNFTLSAGQISHIDIPVFGGVKLTGRKGIQFYDTAGSWLIQMDQAATPTPYSDHVLAFKCDGVGPTCATGYDQIYDNHNQDGLLTAPPVVSGGSDYVNGERIVLTTSCPVSPTLIVTNAIAGVIQAGGVAIWDFGGNGRCVTRATGGAMGGAATAGGSGATFNVTSGLYGPNSPTLAIGAGVGAAIITGYRPYMATFQARSDRSSMGAVAIQTTPGNTGPAFAILNGSAVIDSIDQSGNVTLGAVTKIKGTTTNDSAVVGDIGEVTFSKATLGFTTVTVTIASPGVVTWTGHGLPCASAVYFTTTGALPTGLAGSTNYYITCGPSLLTNSFQLSSTIVNAIAGTSINTSGTQSGTHTGTSAALLSTGALTDVAGVNLTAGQWSCSGILEWNPGGATTVTELYGGINTASATFPSHGSSNSVFYGKEGFTTGAAQDRGLPPTVFKLASTTTMFLSAESAHAVSTMTAAGRIECVRQR